MSTQIVNSLRPLSFIMKHKLSRGEKWLIASVGLAFVILGGGYGWRSYLNREPVVNIPAYPKLPKPNGFDLYTQAAKSLVPATPAVDEVNDRTPPIDPKVRAQQYSLSRKEAWLKQNAAAFQLFQKALRTPCLHPEARSLGSNVFAGGNVFPAYFTRREMARCKKIESNTFSLRGDWSNAMQSKIDTLEMGQDISRGGPLMASLAGIAVAAIGRSEQWPIIEKLNAAECRAAMRRLEKLYDNRVQADAVLLEEKYVGQQQLLEMMRSSDWRQPIIIFGTPVEDSWSTRWKMLTISKRAVMENYTRHVDIHIANAKLSYKGIKKPLPAESDPFTDALTDILDNVRFYFARNDAGNALWLVALALRAYKLENGKYPAGLKELSPKYLKEIPADPFGAGESLRYKNLGSEYSLYSIGPDGIDNGGRPLTHSVKFSTGLRKKLPTVMTDSKGDYVAGKNR